MSGPVEGSRGTPDLTEHGHHPEIRRIHSEGRVVSDRLWNADLAPARQRNWRVRSLFALWMCDVHSIAGYTFAAGLFITGLVGWQVFLALVLGITLVYFLMNFAGTAGQKTGVPYPVLARMSFGLFGANLAALIRALYRHRLVRHPDLARLGSRAGAAVFGVAPVTSLDGPDVPRILGLTPLGWAAFLVLWAVQLLVIRRGMETVRKFQDWAGPAIWVAMFALAIYILTQAGNKFSLSIPGVAPLDGPAALTQFFSAIALTVTYFAALLLNFCDFSRFAPDRKTILRGNFWGLPVNFIAFALVTVVVTAGAASYFTADQYRGQDMFKVITDPVAIVQAIKNPWITIIAAVTFVVATIGINVVANFVSASYDLANVAPHRIDFRRGGLISAVLAIVILPWNLFSSPVVIVYFLGGLGALLGPLFGVIFTDFFRIRHQRLQGLGPVPRGRERPLLLHQGLEPQGRCRAGSSRRRRRRFGPGPGTAELPPGRLGPGPVFMVRGGNPGQPDLLHDHPQRSGDQACHCGGRRLSACPLPRTTAAAPVWCGRRCVRMCARIDGAGRLCAVWFVAPFVGLSVGDVAADGDGVGGVVVPGDQDAVPALLHGPGAGDGLGGVEVVFEGVRSRGR